MHVSYYDEAYDMLLNWISIQPFARTASSSMVSVRDMQRRVFVDDHAMQTKTKPLHYSPWNVSLWFQYKNHLLMFQCTEKDSRQEISISCIGRSPKVLREFFEECRAEYLKQIQRKTSVFEHGEGEWKKTRARDIRPISTVIMDEEEKELVLKDIGDFLHQETRRWYTSRGMPYRRGYLLFGPPGTGKSSFSLSVAGRFELDIYVLNLSGVNDNSLNHLFAELPRQCVILLEDVDAAGAARTDDGERAEKKGGSKSGVTLSGLLNALDGVTSQEGRVLIMTTNHIEHLDDALIRPGRVDRKVFFRLADKKMSSQLFRTIFKQTPEDHRSPERKIDDETIEMLANEFAAKMPEQVFSPAEILSFLLDRKKSPADAVADVTQWVVQTKKGINQLERENTRCHG
jgi:chaperone BCS1